LTAGRAGDEPHRPPADRQLGREEAKERLVRRATHRRRRDPDSEHAVLDAVDIVG
jgi:hypothetical protein